MLFGNSRSTLGNLALMVDSMMGEIGNSEENSRVEVYWVIAEDAVRVLTSVKQWSRRTLGL